MLLNELLSLWKLHADQDCMVKNLQNDSRKIQSNDVFIAYPGAITDGRMYMHKAREAGAVAIIYDPDHMPNNCSLPEDIPCIPMNNLANQLSALACHFYQNKDAAIHFTGITGTNGKTTIAYQLTQAHTLLGHKAIYIGTLGHGEIAHLSSLENTTPDALCLQQLTHQYSLDSVEQICMEVSSHALVSGRVEGIHFRQAIFTNLTQDHLDFHKTMEHYAAAKAQLFTSEGLEWAICNKDDAWFSTMQQAVSEQTKLLTYGLKPDCDVYGKDWRMDLTGTMLKVQSPFGEHEIHLNALGKFNVYNGLAVFSSLLAEGYDPESIIKIMPLLKAAPGRMEIVAQNPCVIVDYAHTPDALENVLSTLNAIKKEGKLWVIFGCGGNRDKTKRPLMGKAASLFADEIMITSDNPRDELPEQIMEDIMQGIDKHISVKTLVDREQAIHYVLERARSQDIVLIAGKGHEAYQQIGQVKRPFSDQGVVGDFLKRKHAAHCQ